VAVIKMPAKQYYKTINVNLKVFDRFRAARSEFMSDNDFVVALLDLHEMINKVFKQT
jgi:hypothetical protein